MSWIDKRAIKRIAIERLSENKGKIMLDEIRSIKSTKKDLKSFGVVMGGALVLLGGVFFWRGKEFYVYLLGLSLLFFLFGFIMPVVLKPVHKAWMSLAIIMGWVVTRVILIVLFYLVVTPVALIARICRKDFLDLKFDKNKNTYWILRKDRKIGKSQYEKQF